MVFWMVIEMASTIIFWMDEYSLLYILDLMDVDSPDDCICACNQ